MDCTLFVRGGWSFYTVRFLLGMAEAGFFPGRAGLGRDHGRLRRRRRLQGWQWLTERLEGEERVRRQHERHTLGEVLKDRRVLLFAVLYFAMAINVYGLSFWVGEIVDQINGVGDVGKGFITAIPYAVAIRVSATGVSPMTSRAAR